ncbi:hypothetical protein RFI_33161 [Reticulomyxa filosa]|uniref:Uncharacterized protein n=1 Tax=Reticulomyxa filosa TaxID=46433 RepID=X6LRI0_RETFI|nr:hypothetical protein RFI_33161 [Reticulomyxa filosa]|eukprot:ETO04239.1 hypothetical protein RFI_33161 [Reticulomyxa filosa]
MIILNGAPLTAFELKRIYDIIVQHDKPAGAIALFVLLSAIEITNKKNTTKKDSKIEILGKELVGLPSPAILFELQVLMDADALAFFAYTIKEFVSFKAKTNTSEWIWARIETNVRRLRPEIRWKAVEFMEKMDLQLQRSMGFNKKSLEKYL